MCYKFKVRLTALPGSNLTVCTDSLTRSLSFGFHLTAVTEYEPGIADTWTSHDLVN